VELVETIVRDPLFEVDIAIKDKNEAKFAESYNHLTEACNACHQAALQTPIVIQDPKESMFPGSGLSAETVTRGGEDGVPHD
jgi:hypothetical protein